MGSALLSIGLAFVAGMFALSAMVLSTKRQRKQDTDIDTILANAERPYLQKAGEP